jgi:hypothetical protein
MHVFGTTFRLFISWTSLWNVFKHLEQVLEEVESVYAWITALQRLEKTLRLGKASFQCYAFLAFATCVYTRFFDNCMFLGLHFGYVRSMAWTSLWNVFNRLEKNLKMHRFKFRYLNAWRKRYNWEMRRFNSTLSKVFSMFWHSLLWQLHVFGTTFRLRLWRELAFETFSSVRKKC